ncbi:MAG: hypothetical protein JRI34_11870 [Deltaproteobacteria bacterium]|nr:hypothetical protein [Deltaproteobacteria bacterium]
MTTLSTTETYRLSLSRILGVMVIGLLLFSYSKWEGISITSTLFFLVGSILVGIASLGRL